MYAYLKNILERLFECVKTNVKKLITHIVASLNDGVLTLSV